jgi:hypothetical protein
MTALELGWMRKYYARGKLRHQFRRRNADGKVILCKTIAGRPGGAEFMAAYQELLEQSEAIMAGQLAAPRLTAGTVDALIKRYKASDAFLKKLSPVVQKARARRLAAFMEFTAPNGNRYGGGKLATIRRKQIDAVLEGKPAATKKDWITTLRGFTLWAREAGEITHDPLAGATPGVVADSDGFLAWDDAAIAKYRAFYPLGTVSRLAIELALNIAARRGDLHIIGHQHLKDGAITWRPCKTSRTTRKVLSIFVLPEFQAALDAMPGSGELRFLLNARGQPSASAAAFGNAFANWCTAAGLEPKTCDDGKVRNYRLHELRKAALIELAYKGATGLELLAISGHKNLSEVQPYIEAAEQKRLAAAAHAKRLAGTKS